MTDIIIQKKGLETILSQDKNKSELLKLSGKPITIKSANKNKVLELDNSLKVTGDDFIINSQRRNSKLSIMGTLNINNSYTGELNINSDGKNTIKIESDYLKFNNFEFNQSLSKKSSPTFSGLDLNKNRITNLSDPKNKFDAVTKNYLDEKIIEVNKSMKVDIDESNFEINTLKSNDKISFDIKNKRFFDFFRKGSSDILSFNNTRFNIQDVNNNDLFSLDSNMVRLRNISFFGNKNVNINADKKGLKINSNDLYLNSDNIYFNTKKNKYISNNNTGLTFVSDKMINFDSKKLIKFNSDIIDFSKSRIINILDPDKGGNLVTTDYFNNIFTKDNQDLKITSSKNITLESENIIFSENNNEVLTIEIDSNDIKFINKFSDYVFYSKSNQEVISFNENQIKFNTKLLINNDTNKIYSNKDDLNIESKENINLIAENINILNNNKLNFDNYDFIQKDNNSLLVSTDDNLKLYSKNKINLESSNMNLIGKFILGTTTQPNDLKIYGTSRNNYFEWKGKSNSLNIKGTINHTGQNNLDVIGFKYQTYDPSISTNRINIFSKDDGNLYIIDDTNRKRKVKLNLTNSKNFNVLEIDVRTNTTYQEYNLYKNTEKDIRIHKIITEFTTAISGTTDLTIRNKSTQLEIVDNTYIDPTIANSSFYYVSDGKNTNDYVYKNEQITIKFNSIPSAMVDIKFKLYFELIE